MKTAIFILAITTIIVLSGCSANDAQYIGCIARDRTSNPCQ